jgi:hypothetical protein
MRRAEGKNENAVPRKGIRWGVVQGEAVGLVANIPRVERRRPKPDQINR